MRRTQEQRRAVALVRSTANAIVKRIDESSPGFLGTEFNALFHFECTRIGPVETNWADYGNGRRPLRITHTIFVPMFSRQ